MQNNRMDSIENRLIAVEQAVVELALMAKWLRILVVIVAGSVGLDITGMVA